MLVAKFVVWQELSWLLSIIYGSEVIPVLFYSDSNHISPFCVVEQGLLFRKTEFYQNLARLVKMQ